jgi:PAS domain S-box-containing protein
LNRFLLFYQKISLRKKILSWIVFAVIFLFIILIVLNRVVVLGSFQELEKRATKKNVEQVMGELLDELTRLSSFSYDYAAWDDTYEFIRDRNQLYIKNNLYSLTFDNLNINYFILINNLGRVIYSANYTKATGTLETVSKDFLKEVLATKNLLNPGENGKSSFLMVNGAPIMIASRNVLKSDVSGPSRGILLLGKLLDQEEIERISKITQLKPSIFPLLAEKQTPEVTEILPGFSDQKKIIIKPLNSEKIAGYTVLQNANHKDILLLKVEAEREIYKIGEATISYYLLWHFGIVIVLVFLLIYSLDKIILTRLLRHTNKLNRLRETSDLSMRLDVQGADELSHLAMTINNMIEDLEEYQKHKTRQNIRDLIENSFVGICILQDDRIMYSNPEFEKIFGNQNSINFKKLNVLPQDEKQFDELYERMVSHVGTPLDIEFRFLFFDPLSREETIKWVHMRTSTFEYQQKNAILVSLVDITEFKDMENVILIKEKMASLGSVAAGIAHEIRNPLSGINFTLDAVIEDLRERDNTTELISILESSKKGVRKMESVIKRVLDFSKPHLPDLKPADINVPIEEAIKLSRVAIRKINIHLKSDLSPDLPLANIDNHLIEQVVLNLINNATDAMGSVEDNLQILISSSQEKDHVVFTVADQGPGISKNIFEKVFDPFFTTKNDGSGIGLSICQRIVADHNGTIKLSPSKLGGAEFKIKIPIANKGVLK